MKKKQLNERSFKSRVPLYDYAVVELVMTSCMKETEDKRGITDRAQAHTLGDNNRVTVIIKDTAPLHHIAHEAVHVATHVLFTAGVKADLENDEPIAYVVDWFVRWSLRCVKKDCRLAPLATPVKLVKPA